MDAMIGKTLGPYRILEKIGQGGMATVYEAYQPALERTVALKTLPSHLLDNPNFAQRFRREARAVASLEHPHILPVYDYGQEESVPYLVMRHIEGGTLKERMGQPLELRQVAELIGQIAEALDYAHEHGVVHRDVKPSNVLLDRGEWVLLTDFGVARMLEGVEQITGTGVGVGTPAYMSPEQGQGKKVDRRSDVYSLGVVLYEMLTGRVPYQAETPLAIVWKHVHEPLPLPRSVNPSIPEGVERVVLKALAKAAEDRYPSAGELARALQAAVGEVKVDEERLLRGEELTQDVAPEPPPSAPRLRRRKALAYLVPGALVALTVVVLARGGILGIISKWPTLPTATVTHLDTPVRTEIAFQGESSLFASPTASLQRQVSPTAAAITPTPTLVARGEPPARGELLFEENFDDNRNYWFLNDDHYLQDGEYHISATGVGSFVIGSAPVFGDFILEVGARKVEGLYSSGWGIHLRAQDDLQRSYVVGVSGNGEVSFQWAFPGPWEQVAPFPIVSPYVNKGNASNKLTVVARGPAMDVYVNDQLVGSATDDSLPEGTIEVLNGPVVHVAFDYIRVYALGESEAPETPSTTPMPGANPNIWQHITFNLDDPVVGELAIRQAIAYGTDRQALGDSWSPPYRPIILNSYVRPDSPYYAGDSNLTLYSFDPARARSVLEEAGWIDSDGDGVRDRGGTRLQLE